MLLQEVQEDLSRWGLPSHSSACGDAHVLLPRGWSGKTRDAKQGVGWSAVWVEDVAFFSFHLPWVRSGETVEKCRVMLEQMRDCYRRWCRVGRPPKHCVAGGDINVQLPP